MIVENWRDVLTKAWSIRFILLAGLLTGVEYIIPSLGVPHWAVGLTIGAAFIARIVAQKDV